MMHAKMLSHVNFGTQELQWISQTSVKRSVLSAILGINVSGGGRLDKVVGCGHEGCGFESSHDGPTSPHSSPLLTAVPFLKMTVVISVIKEINVKSC